MDLIHGFFCGPKRVFRLCGEFGGHPGNVIVEFVVCYDLADESVLVGVLSVDTLAEKDQMAGEFVAN